MMRSSDAELKPVLRVLRSKLRELTGNDEYAWCHISLLRNGAVGPHGISVQCTARNAGGSIDGSGNWVIENAREARGKRRTLTVDGGLSFEGGRGLGIENLARNGDVFVRFGRIRNPGRPRLG